MIAKFLSAAWRSSFFLPMQLMGRDQRQALRNLYRFCYVVDDITDSSITIEQKRQQLEHISQVVALCYRDAKAVDTSYDWLVNMIGPYQLEQTYFDEIIAGMHMDVNGEMLKPSLEHATRYCYRVAGCVGLLALPIFGAQSEQAQKFAVALGHALQWTNIIRDVVDDAKIGRIYLPQEWLEAEGLGHITPEDVLANPQAVRVVCEKAYAQAMYYYEQTNNYVDDPRALRSALMMREIYKLLLQQIYKDGFRYQQPYRLSMVHKIWGCWKGVTTPDVPAQ